MLILKFITITITIILAVLSVSVHFETLMLIVTFPILQELNIPEVLDNICVCDKVCVCDCEGELSWISEKAHSISCRYGWSAWLSSEKKRDKYNLELWPETTKQTYLPHHNVVAFCFFCFCFVCLFDFCFFFSSGLI